MFNLRKVSAAYFVKAERVEDGGSEGIEKRMPKGYSSEKNALTKKTDAVSDKMLKKSFLN